MHRFIAFIISAVVGLFVVSTAARSGESLTAPQQSLLRFLDAKQPELIAINQDIWNYAELGLEETKSSARLVGELKQAGFRVKEGVADMPTAFVAEYGSGKPIIGILAEYDALPELSQQITTDRKTVEGRTTGHGCGHCAFGTASVGAALAVKDAIDRFKLKGTVRVYGTPAEETLIGKVYMTLAGQFNDLDACLHWHPGAKNRVSYMSSKAMVSAKFTFTGLAAHASGSPHRGRSALDGVELMNVGVNYMREHVKETSRMHYVITNGGGQPNVVPATAQVWYFVRANTHEDAEYLFDWVRDIADAGAKMSRTKVAVQIDTDCHEIIPNRPLSEVILRNFKRVGAPPFTDADRAFAAKIQESMRSDPIFKETKPLHEEIEDLPDKPTDADGGSTDVGDVSWKVPTSGFSAATFALGSPGHSWQNVAAIGSPIGHKGMLVAAKVLALTTVELFNDPEALKDARADFDERMKEKKYTTRIPRGQKAPKKIR